MTWAVLLLILAVASMVVLYNRTSRDKPTQESFFVANRNVSWKTCTMTLTANWFQAPATLLSANIAFSGLGNFLMFLIPNTLAMILPGFLVEKIVARVRTHPERVYTLPQFTGTVFGKGVRFMFFVSSFGALIGAMSYTLSGLAQWLEPLGVNTWYLAISMTVCAYLWAYPWGIIGSIRGDMIKICALLALVVGATIVVYTNWGNPGPYREIRIVPENTTPLMVFWTWGLALGVSLLGGFFCNPDLGERTYIGVKRSNYFTGAAIFALGVVACGSIGFLAWHLNITPGRGELVTFATLNSLVGGYTLFVVGLLLLVVLTAAFASMFASAADLLAVELISPWKPHWKDGSMIVWSRALMILPIVLAMYLATRDKTTLDLGLILLSLAVIRGQTIVPIFLAVFAPKVSGQAIFFGMIVAFIGGIGFMFGAPIWNTLTGGSIAFLADHGRPIGALVALVTPLLFALPSLISSRDRAENCCAN